MSCTEAEYGSPRNRIMFLTFDAYALFCIKFSGSSPAGLIPLMAVNDNALFGKACRENT